MSLKDIPAVALFGRLQDIPETIKLCMELSGNSWWKAICVGCACVRYLILAALGAGLVWYMVTSAIAVTAN